MYYPNYRPPPAQAQAHPAQAQAHAQELPPPPPRKPLDPLLGRLTGIGLVRLVTAPVKPVRSPTTPAETAVAPLMIEAAKSEPGMLGMEMDGFDPPPPETEETGLASPDAPPTEGLAAKPGLYRCHQ